MKTYYILKNSAYTKSLFVFTFFLSFSFLGGCTSGSDNKDFILINDLKSLPEFDEKKHKVVLIMPSSGCSGCISAVEEFVKEHKFSSLFLILTNSISQKDAVYRLDLIDPLCDYFWDSKKTFFDINESESIYPKIVYWNEEDVYKSRVERVRPENPTALAELEDFLVNLKFD